MMWGLTGTIFRGGGVGRIGGGQNSFTENSSVRSEVRSERWYGWLVLGVAAHLRFEVKDTVERSQTLKPACWRLPSSRESSRVALSYLDRLLLLMMLSSAVSALLLKVERCTVFVRTIHSQQRRALINRSRKRRATANNPMSSSQMLKVLLLNAGGGWET